MAGIASIFSGLFSGAPKSSIGLSIGSSAIKLVELGGSKSNTRLLHFGMVALPQDAIVNREIVNPVAVTEHLRQLVGAMQLKTRKVCASISGNSCIIKRMQIEAPNIKELQDQVFWEAEQYLPFDASEVVMDYQLLSYSKEKRADVLLVAIKRSILESYMACISDAGLEPAIMDVDYFAIQNAFEFNYPLQPGEAAAIIDIGATSTKVAILHDGAPVFTKDSALGGMNLTAEIQRHLNLPFADAETLKTGASGGVVPQEVNDLTQVYAENVAREIKRTLDFYSASSSGPPVNYLVLCGGSAQVPHLSRVVEEIAGLPTQIMNPFNAISYDPAMFTAEYVASIGPVAAVPIGLAFRAGAAK
ncbi:MAG: type IV pilus assembly protein PilM [Oligoflexia bacterium]